MSLVRDLFGEGWVMCQICFEVRKDSDPGWAVDESGAWDVCSGDCAKQAGVVEVTNGSEIAQP